MPNPNNFLPFFQRIIQVCEQELGNNGRVIPSGSFTFNTNFPGKDDGNLGRDTLFSPTFHIQNTRLIDQNRLPENCSLAPYDIEITIQMGHGIPQSLTPEDTTRVNADLMNKVHIIRRALSDPNNLANTILGDDTGLSSGMLNFIASSPPRFNFSAGLVVVDITFMGYIWVNFV